MKCEHKWLRRDSFMEPNTPWKKYKCELCDQTIETVDAPCKEIEQKIANAEREKCAVLAEKLTWSDNKGIASAIRARNNL